MNDEPKGPLEDLPNAGDPVKIRESLPKVFKGFDEKITLIGVDPAFKSSEFCVEATMVWNGEAFEILKSKILERK